MMEYGYEKIADYIKDSISIDHVVKEVGNAIQKAYIKNYITEDNALKRFLNLIKLTKYVIKLINEIDLIEKAGEIAIKSKISLYDSLYIALALKEKAKLLSMLFKLKQLKNGIEIIKV